MASAMDTNAGDSVVCGNEHISTTSPNHNHTFARRPKKKALSIAVHYSDLSKEWPNEKLGLPNSHLDVTKVCNILTSEYSPPFSLHALDQLSKCQQALLAMMLETSKS